MICRASYNEVCDISPVDQFGYVDLGAAFVNGVVPPFEGAIDEAFNKIDDPRSILGAPRNLFDAFELGRDIRSYTPPASDVNGSESIDKGE